MRVLRECFVLGLLTVGGCVFSLLAGWSPSPWNAFDWGIREEISITSTRGKSVLWVDARSKEAFAMKHVPGAVHLAEENWDAEIIDLMAAWIKDPRMIVVYCDNADCGTSQRLAKRLREAFAGVEVYALKGGWEAFEQ